ncbi:ABC transporter permease [Anaerorhabdus furcosa]|uniref:MacB-like core domain-containing protein n=1 Tax=Anaerorhabdus furcosa TaxID=118967 RepID=A0A1T4K6K2_9FIRM|nr:ABC transporter permease [Anaerorhabdus furcosa]SJZ37953.1 MacB-like core domain-containing protein [Anaerorhabdus furcosa]
MNYLKRAILYCKRKTSKSIILGITFFMIGNLVLVGLGISNAAENAKKITRDKMRAVVNYEIDYDSFWKEMDKLESDEERTEFNKNMPRVNNENVKKMMADERVSAVNQLTSTMVYSIGIENVPVGNENKKNENSSGASYDAITGKEYVYQEANLFLMANAYPNMIEFEDGTFTLEQGRMYTQDDMDNSNRVALITKELAEVNGLQIGDTFKYVMFQNDQLEQYKTTMGLTDQDCIMEVEIIGIYSTKNDVDPNSDQFDWMAPYESPKNVILLPLTAYADYSYNLISKVYDYFVSTGNFSMIEGQERPVIEDYLVTNKATFLLKSAENIESFVSDHQSLEEQFIKFNSNEKEFKELAKPLDTLSFFANVIVWIVAINAVVIISLVTALTLKTREFEIGVLLSLGVSKVKVVMQLFAELLIVAFLGFTLAVGTGSLIAGKVGELVLDYQQSNTEEEIQTDVTYGGIWDQDYFTRISQDELLENYNVSIEPLLIIEIYGLGVLVVFISILIPSIMIMRLNPKRIMLS